MKVVEKILSKIIFGFWFLMCASFANSFIDYLNKMVNSNVISENIIAYQLMLFATFIIGWGLEYVYRFVNFIKEISNESK